MKDEQRPGVNKENILIHYQENFNTIKAPSCPDFHTLEFVTVIQISF